MHPAFSVIFLTTLIGAGQGLFLALYTGQLYSLAISRKGRGNLSVKPGASCKPLSPCG